MEKQLKCNELFDSVFIINSLFKQNYFSCIEILKKSKTKKTSLMAWASQLDRRRKMDLYNEYLYIDMIWNETKGICLDFESLLTLVNTFMVEIYDQTLWLSYGTVPSVSAQARYEIAPRAREPTAALRRWAEEALSAMSAVAVTPSSQDHHSTSLNSSSSLHSLSL